MNLIKIAESPKEVRLCYPIMAELRPHLDIEAFVSQVRRQTVESSYRLVYLSDGEIKAVGGLRIAEWLAGGKSLEIEDLVCAGSDRSRGYGGELFDWIINYARQHGCTQLKLVSNVKRARAHRFYLNKGMTIEAHYFSLPI